MQAMYKKHTVAVIIPAFNESASIECVISELQALRSSDDVPLVDDIIVCDNDSTDATGQIARHAGARVIRETQHGYGAACLAGIKTLNGPDIVVFVDADHSVSVTEMPALLSAIVAGSDVVIGSRVSNMQEKDALTLPQRTGNILASRLIRLLWGEPVTDLGPFRAIRYSSLIWLNMQDKRYGWTVEMQVKAIQAGMLITEIPVSTLKRIGHSKISGTVKGVIGAAMGIFGTIFNLWFKQKTGKLKIIKKSGGKNFINDGLTN